MRIPLFYAMSAALFLSGSACLAQTTGATAPVPTNSAPTTPAGTAPVTAQAKDAVFTQEQLAQMLAPIALYPDPLLAQVLMASTYPGEIAEAVTWSKAHPDAKGDEAVKQVASQPWDPSVQALVAFPQVLATLMPSSRSRTISWMACNACVIRRKPQAIFRATSTRT
jgi:hypothetical protein